MLHSMLSVKIAAIISRQAKPFCNYVLFLITDYTGLLMVG